MNALFSTCALILISASTTLPASAASDASDAAEHVVESLEGTWSSHSEDGPSTMIQIAPVELDGFEHALYVERVAADAPWEPIEQSLFQVYTFEDGLRLRKLEITKNNLEYSVYTGLGAAPQTFPQIDPQFLIPVLDMDIETHSDGFEARTPHPFPTIERGAVEYTSTMRIDGDSLVISEQGFDATRDQIWDEGEVRFERSDPYAVADIRDNRLVIISYPSSTGGEVIQAGDRMAIHYAGFFGDGRVFDASYFRGQPFEFQYPPGDRAIVGWGLSMEGFAEDERRKLVIPGDLAYGESGNPQAGIAPNTTLYFNTHFVRLTRVAPAPTTPATPTLSEPVETPQDD